MIDLQTLLWLALGGILLGLMTGRAIIPLAAWLAPVFLLHAAHRAPGTPTLVAIWVVTMIAAGIANRDIIPIPGLAYVTLIAATAAIGMLPFVADQLIAPRLPPFASTLIFPLAWVAVELANHRTPSGTWGALAYTQHDNLALMQLVSVTGLSGLTFLITWCASAVNQAWDRGFAPDALRVFVLPVALVLGVVLFAGALRLWRAPTDARPVRVAAISYPGEMFVPGEVTRFRYGQVASDEVETARAKLAQLHEWYFTETRREARAGAKLVAWPEVNLVIFADDEPRFLECARRLARDERIWLAMGMATARLGAPRPHQNKLVFVNPQGDIAAEYHKTRLAPGPEATLATKGDGRLPVLETEFGRMSAAICFDGDHPELIRQSGKAGCDLFVLPSNDWLEIKHVHLAMASCRAIENGVAMLRPTSTGISAAIDPYGRTVATADSFAPGARTMVAQLPVHGVRTIYARVGDAFGWLCVAGLAGSTMLAVIR